MKELAAYVLLTVLVIGALIGAGWKLGTERLEDRWQARWADRDAKEATVRADAVQAARIEEQRRAAANLQAAQDARTQNTVIDLGIGQLSSAAVGLRFDAAELSKSSSPAACDTSATDRGEATRRAAMVLSDLLGRCSATLEELAPAYDRARNAGLTCERATDSLNTH